MPLETWLAFLVTSLVISISPGPGAVASMSSGAAYGWKRGYWNAFGLQLGILLQMLIIALGLGAVITATPAAYEAIRWFGVAYLLYIGVKLWLPPRPEKFPEAEAAAAPSDLPPLSPTETALASRRALVIRGFIINCSNPKALVFLLAVLPQFLARDLPQIPQYLVMTATTVSIDLAVMAVYTLLGARLLRLMQSPRQRQLIDRVFGGIFLLVALGLALHRQHA